MPYEWVAPWCLIDATVDSAMEISTRCDILNISYSMEAKSMDIWAKYQGKGYVQ